jgi:Mg-chelatase subunit ChlD
MFVAFLSVFACAAAKTGKPTVSHEGAADAKKHEPVAIAFVIDRSGSMAGVKLDAARRGVREAIAVLGEADRIAIIAYDLKADVVVQLEEAKANATRDKKLAEVSASGGTDFRPALQAARAQLAGATAAKRKLVVFLTDGESPFDDVKGFGETMTAAKITISTIGVPGNSDDELLKQIASKTGGRFHKLASADDLAKTIVEEAQYLVDAR